VALFVDRYGGGDIKLFGGEPLLAPEVVRATFRAAQDNPGVRRVYLSTNGLGLTESWLSFLADQPKGILTISMDGAPADHRRFRRALPGVPDAYDHIVALLTPLHRTPRVVITQTIAPAAARNALANFDHLRSLGFRRFNLLPGYYLPWRPEQLAHLERGLEGIGRRFQEAWAQDHRLYLRNLFTWAPTPFFNTGLVVDSDRSIHPSNVGLSGALDHTRSRTVAGDLDRPPTPAALAAKAAEVNPMLRDELPSGVWESTQAADAALSRLCQSLYPAFVAMRRRRRAAAAP
jgi:hypothetical protein